MQRPEGDSVSETRTAKLEKNHEGDFDDAVLGRGSGQRVTATKEEENHSLGQYKAFIDESATRRAEKVKEDEELKNMRASLSASAVQS